jgi:hypothetical protein
LDSDLIAQTIQQDVIKQGGVSLKTVTCPKGIQPGIGKTFECIGEINSGYTFTIAVKQQDDQGSVIWDVPNTKGLLNMAKFESLIQAAVSSEIGSRSVIQCGDTLYRAVKAGQTFDCKVEVKEHQESKGMERSSEIPERTAMSDGKSQRPAIAIATAKPKQPDKIVVTIDTENNVSWQRVVASAIQSTSGTTKPSSVKESGTTQSGIPPATTASPPVTKGNAEEFLNQPGALDKLED